MRCLLIFLVFVSSNVLGLDKNSFFKETSGFLSKHVTNGKVAYRNIKKDPSQLNRLVDYIGSAKLNTFSSEERKAFYINSYNILVIKNIVDHYPVNSPMKVDGFFDEIKHSVGGEMITLNELEKQKLINASKDERLHFALVCAARGCPELRNVAYTPYRLSQQLEQQTLNTLNDQQFISVYDKSKKVLVSQIFKWYMKDFVNSESELIGYLNKYRENKIDPSYSIEYYDYGWTLNDNK